MPELAENFKLSSLLNGRKMFEVEGRIKGRAITTTTSLATR